VNLKEILSYFKRGDTNAYAESLNSKLQRFLRENFGVKNLDFFLCRINRILILQHKKQIHYKSVF